MAIPLDPIRKIGATTAGEICAQLSLDDDARAYLTPSLSPQGFLALLDDGGLLTAAIRFLAFALPVREGVWWSCMAGSAMPVKASGEMGPGYVAAQNWVYKPDDEHRFACFAAAEAERFETAGSYAALASFWSGGSMAPQGMPEVEPDRSLAPTAIAASILLAVAANDPKDAARLYRRALRQGVEIGNGGEGRFDASQGDASGREAR